MNWEGIQKEVLESDGYKAINIIRSLQVVNEASTFSSYFSLPSQSNNFLSLSDYLLILLIYFFKNVT